MTGVNLLKKRIKKNLPPKGMVQVLVITEKQFASIEDFLGGFSSKKLNSMERLVIL
jgi:CRISPR-associated protein Cas2